MFYVIRIIRNEEGEITNRKIEFRCNKWVKPQEFENEIIKDETDHDLSLVRVSVDENGQLFIENDPDKIALQASEAGIALRISRIQFGQRLIAMMSIRNDAKELSGAQIVQLISDFSSINQCWLNGSIATSRALIDALTPDETILTTADKVAMLSEIDANLTALGY